LRDDANPIAEIVKAQIASRFAGVDIWVFDLDNTLYPADSDLWPKIDERMTVYLSDLLGLDGLSSRALQKFYYQRYGTTLEGLMRDHKINPDHFLDFAHDIDRSSIKPDLGLAKAIGALPGRRLILTNGSRDHAIKTTQHLGLDHLFEDVFDIVAAQLVPKPAPQVYEKFFDRHGIDPMRAAMFDDIARNLTVPYAHGMRTVLVTPRQGQTDHREAWETTSQKPPNVDFVTDDLAGFVALISASLPRTQNP
jgi:putative hydrolase of the HAD superfamily